MNQGAAGFRAAAPIGGNDDSRGVVVVDLFGDALPELVVANGDGNAVVYRNTAGAFSLELPLPTGPAVSVATGDLNNDGKADLVFGRATAAPPGLPSDLVLLNTSGTSGSFFLSDELGASPTSGVSLADLDLDGDADVLAVNPSGAQIYSNAGVSGGTFALSRTQIGNAGSRAAAASKLGVDDRIDVALVGAGGVAVFYNDGSGNLGLGDTAAPTIALRGEPSMTLIVGTAYTDAGATASDVLDGDVSSRIVVTNPVDTAVLGTYTVTYNATDLVRQRRSAGHAHGAGASPGGHGRGRRGQYRRGATRPARARRCAACKTKTVSLTDFAVGCWAHVSSHDRLFQHLSASGVVEAPGRPKAARGGRPDCHVRDTCPWHMGCIYVLSWQDSKEVQMSSQRARIAARAYALWERRGKPEGSSEMDWYAAEKELARDDLTKPKATLDSLQQTAADVLTNNSDRGPIASDTERTSPEGPPPKRSRVRRSASRPIRDNGGARRVELPRPVC